MIAFRSAGAPAVCADSPCLLENNPGGVAVRIGLVENGCAACACNEVVATEGVTWPGVKAQVPVRRFDRPTPPAPPAPASP